MRRWRAASAGLQVAHTWGEQCVCSGAGLLFTPRQAEEWSGGNHAKLSRDTGKVLPQEGRAPATGQAGHCPGSSPMEQAVGVLLGSRWDVGKENALTAKLARDHLGFGNRRRTSRARKGNSPLHLDHFRGHLCGQKSGKQLFSLSKRVEHIWRYGGIRNSLKKLLLGFVL